jgi:hypothetical protein
MGFPGEGPKEGPSLTCPWCEVCFKNEKDAQDRLMCYVLWAQYGIADPRLIFMLADKLENGSDLELDRRALASSFHKCGVERPWVIVRGAPQIWEYTVGAKWVRLDLGGCPRWQKAITCHLGVGITITSGYAIKNTPASESELFMSQRTHQRMHCDLMNPRLMQTRSSSDVVDKVFVLLAPMANEPIALQVWDHTIRGEITLWINPGSYVLFRAGSCWHAGYGGAQGGRLYVTLVAGELTHDQRECLLEDQDFILFWDDVKRMPSSNPAIMTTK